MKTWGFEPVQLLPEPMLAHEAMEAILDAGDALEAEHLILFDLRTDVQTRIVALPVTMHRHDQDCARA